MRFAKGKNKHAQNVGEDTSSRINPLALIRPTVVNRAKSTAGIGTLYARGAYRRTSKIVPAVRSSLFQPVDQPSFGTGRFFDRSHDKVQIAGITQITASEPFIRGATFKGFLPPVQQGSVRFGAKMQKQPTFTKVVPYPRAVLHTPVYRLTGR